MRIKYKKEIALSIWRILYKEIFAWFQALKVNLHPVFAKYWRGVGSGAEG